MDIRLIQPGDIAACNDLHNKFSHNPRTLEQWQWDFQSPLYKSDQMPFAVVDDDGRIAGTQAFIPIPMIDTEGAFWSAKSEETLVDPDYRGKKLFDKMYDLLFAYAREHHFRYIWGFTPATKSFIKIGFKIPGSTEQILFPFSARGISDLIETRVLDGRSTLSDRLRMLPYKMGARMARVKASTSLSLGSSRYAKESDKGLTTRIEQSAPAESGAVCRRFVERFGGCTIHRDQDYLDWRVFRNPYTRPIMRSAYCDGELVGWIIYSIDDRGVGYIVDVMAAPSESDKHSALEIVKRLLYEATVELKRTGVIAVRGWTVTEHPFDRIVRLAARSLGYFHVRRGHAMVILSPEETRHETIERDYPGWYISRLFTEGVAG